MKEIITWVSICLKRVIFSFFLLYLLNLSTTSFTALNAEVVESVYYFVNKDIISQTDFEDRYALFKKDVFAKDFGEEEGRTFVISNLILEKLVSQKLKEIGILVTDSEVSNQIKQTMQGAGINDFNTFKMAIQQQLKVDFLEYFKSVKRRLKFTTFISKLAVVPPPGPREVEDYYKKNSEKFELKNEIYDLSLLFLKMPPNAGFSVKRAIEKKLLGIVEKIDSGEITFAEAATKHSQEPQTSKSEGRIGWIDPVKQQMTQVEKDVIGKTETGKISKPIVLRGGIGVYLVHEKKKEGSYPKKLAMEISRNELFVESRQSAAANLIKDLYNAAFIKRNTGELAYQPSRSKNTR